MTVNIHFSKPTGPGAGLDFGVDQYHHTPKNIDDIVFSAKKTHVGLHRATIAMSGQWPFTGAAFTIVLDPTNGFERTLTLNGVFTGVVIYTITAYYDNSFVVETWAAIDPDMVVET